MEREIINYPGASRAIETRLAGRVTPALFTETETGAAAVLGVLRG